MINRKIMVICGSTQFREEIKHFAYMKTLCEYLVLFPPFAKEEIPNLEDYREELEIQHLQKIRLADIILIFNKNGYMGEHTKKELKYALELEKKIRFYEPLNYIELDRLYKELFNLE